MIDLPTIAPGEMEVIFEFLRLNDTIEYGSYPVLMMNDLGSIVKDLWFPEISTSKSALYFEISEGILVREFALR